MIQLTKKDRLILINQYKILASLDKDDESHYLELIQILENGYSIFYPMIDE
ncbi:YfbU family protein, partial [Pseudomonas paralactis]|nr:YfbU family protein [Pseudomonas paralactis]